MRRNGKLDETLKVLGAILVVGMVLAGMVLFEAKWIAETACGPR